MLLAFAWYFPKVRLIVIPVPIPLPAWLVVSLYALLELIFGITGTQQSVAHFAHLGGMLGGALAHSLLARPATVQFLGASQPYRAALRAAGIAQQQLPEAVAAEDSPVRERDPVTAALDARVHATHVQGALGIGAERRPALHFQMHRQHVLGTRGLCAARSSRKLK